MTTIYKYHLELVDYQEIHCKRHAIPLSVQEQNGIICLWVEVDTDQPDEKLEIYTVGTGHPLPEDKILKHISTLIDVPFVWHFYTRDWKKEFDRYQ